MGNIRALESIENVLEINIDAYHSYTQAINALDGIDIIDTFKRFRDEYKFQIKSLFNIVSDFGGKKPFCSLDVSDESKMLYAEFRNITGITGVLKSMHTIELVAMDRYQTLTANEELPEKVNKILKKHLNSVKSHIAFINQASANIMQREVVG